MTRPLRFCLITTFYPPYNFGGDGVDVERLARALVARGHRVTVVHDVDAYASLSPTLPPLPPDDGTIELIRLHSRMGAMSPLLTHQFGRPVVHHRRLSKLFRDGAFDVVTFNNISLAGGPGLLSFGGDALRLYMAHEHWLVCPTHVLWRHNREACTGRQCLRCVLNSRRPPQLWRYTGYLERQLRHVDTFVARSEFSRAKHREFGFSRPMTVLPYFLAGDLPERPKKSGRPSPHPRPYFLFVGRLERIKGLDTVIPVLARYSDADLLIVGDGTQMANLQALAAGNPRVTFVGRVPNDELAPYYEHALAALVPSVGFETFGIVLIEALRQETPVIARRIGPFTEIVEQSSGGELFGNDDELLAAMRRVQENPSRRAAMGLRGYQACRERWSEGVVVPRYLDIVAQSAHERALRLGVPAPAWVSA